MQREEGNRLAFSGQDEVVPHLVKRALYGSELKKPMHVDPLWFNEGNTEFVNYAYTCRSEKSGFALLFATTKGDGSACEHRHFFVSMLQEGKHRQVAKS